MQVINAFVGILAGLLDHVEQLLDGFLDNTAGVRMVSSTICSTAPSARYPAEFVEDHWPSGFEKKDAAAMSDDDRKTYFKSLGQAVERDARLYRRIMNRMRDAMDLSIKRTAWNFKTAIPTYYPVVKKLQLLLPICLVSDDAVDLALAVEKTPSGRYLAHTVLPLDWAYKNARLVCRPDSDWLAPAKITAELDEQEE